MKDFVCWFVLRCLPRYWTLGGFLANWYRKNGYYFFKPGNIIKLKSHRLVGYGVEPIGTVIGYNEVGYRMTVTSYITENGEDWLYTGKVPEDATTITEIQNHFKWNIEHHWKIAPKKG
jgi:hypothetical protein